MTENKKSILKSIGKAVSYLVVIVICWLWFGHGCKSTKEPVNKEPKEIIKEQDRAVKTDSIASAHFKDSVNKIVAYWKGQSNHWENNWNREVEDNAALQDTIGKWLNSEPIPDTCEKFRKQAIIKFDKLSLSSAKKDTACSKALSALKNVVTQKDVLIGQGVKDYSKLKSRYDTVSSLAKKLLPKNEFGMGATVISSYLIPKPQVGVNLYFRNKRGWQIEIGYYTNNYISGGVKKPLARF